MSKLSQLKKFHTLKESAEYLSSELKEPVSLATIYQLIADKQLMLSVRLVNQAYVMKGQFVECEDGDLVEFRTELTSGKVLEKSYFDYVTDDNSLPIRTDMYFVYDNKAHIVDGIWDLAMVGEESLRVEDLYQNEVNGPVPALTDTWGFYLKQGEVVCRLITKSQEKISEIQESIHDGYEYWASMRDLSVDEFMSFIEECAETLSEDEIEALGYFNYLANLPDDSLEFYEDSRSLEENSCQLVIKTDELTRLIQSLDMELERPIQKDKSLLKEHTTFLLLLYILLKEQSIDPYKRGMASPIRLMTENAGYPLSQNTIRNVLGQICNELDSSAHEDKELSTKERQTLIKILYVLLKEEGVDPSEREVASLMLKKANAAGYSLLEDIVCTILEQTADFIA
ncbi:hypothetical protein [Vibrio sinaloensis]|uniref:Uncharacterized protein n=1 Tax=Photobacterium sp. (strain ATCC 43367) TaxID=379097 RepID=A0A0A5I098_PHOS4|nr:hypothetical protein [Vibrio sinaloensis]KGY09201.1 hypothetical protein NM06_08040 [Vibrio sinaloensis]